MQRATHATTPSAVKLETSAREQQVDAPGYIVLQKKGAKHLISYSSKKTKPLDCSCYNPFNTLLTSQDGLKWQAALQANGCTVKCLSHSSFGKKKRESFNVRAQGEDSRMTAAPGVFFWPTMSASTANVYEN